MPENPVDLLFSAYRRRVLGLLLMRPEDSLHVREIARLTGVPAGSLHRELRALSDAGLLLREPAGNQVRYKANRLSPIFPELAGILRKTAGMVDVLREALAPAADRIEAAFMFGSMASGEETGQSDVDIFVIGKAKFSEVVALLTSMRERLGREINPVVMSRKEFNKQRAERDRFVERVMQEPRLLVMGSDDDLG